MALTYRVLPALPVHNESQSPNNVTLGAAPATFPVTFPKQSGGLPIVAMRFVLTVNLTYSTAPSSSPGTVGQFIQQILIYKGSDKDYRYNIASMAELQRIYHMLTGLSLSDVSIPASTSATATLEFIIPFRIKTVPQVPLLKVVLAPWTVLSATPASGSASLSVEYLYGTPSDVPVDDYLTIVSTPTALNANTEINISQYFGSSDPMIDIWVDATADANLNYAKFAVGKSTIYDKMGPFTLTQMETQQGRANYTHISGFFRMPQPAGQVYPAQGVAADVPQLIVNLANSVALNIYLFSTRA